jgi:hypothetical protein
LSFHHDRCAGSELTLLIIAASHARQAIAGTSNKATPSIEVVIVIVGPAANSIAILKNGYIRILVLQN